MEAVLTLAMIIGTYSGVGIENIMDTPIMQTEIVFEINAPQIADTARGAALVEQDGKQVIRTGEGFELSFETHLQASDFILEVDCWAPDVGSDSYFVHVDGRQLEQLILPPRDRIRTNCARFSIAEAGSHTITITLREAPGSVISGVRVAHKTVVPPQPAMRQELVGQHPRIYFTEDDIPEMRQRLSAPLVQEMYELPGYLERKPPEFQPGQRNGAPYRRLTTHALRYVLNPDHQQRDAILEWLDMATTYGDVGVDLDAAYFLEGVALAYDWMYDDIPEDLRNRVRDTIAQKCRKIYEASLVGRSGGGLNYQQNHYWFSHMALALGAAAVYGEVPEAELWLAWAWDRFERIALTFGPDGGFHEGPSYWDYSMPTLYKYVDLYEFCSGEDVPYMDIGLQGQAEFRWHHQVPGFHKLAPLEDSHKNTKGAPARLFLWEAARFQDPVTQGLARLRQQTPDSSAFTFLWVDPQLDAVDPREHMPTAAYYPDVETAFSRTSWEDDATHAIFVSRPLGGHKWAELCEEHGIGGTGHNHPEQNHFFLFGRGATLAGDPGYTYDKQTRNHNTVLIDGQGQYGDGETWPSPKPGRAHITHFATDGVSTIAVGDATSAYPGELGLTQFERTFAVADKDLVVVYDRLAAKQASTFSWLLHHWGEVEEADGRYMISRKDARMTLHPLLPEVATAEQTTYRPQYVHAERDLTPEEPDVNLLTLKSPETAETQFLVPIQISDAGTEPPQLQYTEGSGYRAVQSGGAFVAFNTSDDTIEIQLPWGKSIETAARAVVVRNTPDGVTAIESMPVTPGKSATEGAE